MPWEIVAEKVRSYPARHVVLTGGEPMIAPHIRALAQALHRDGYHLTVETAGTVPPEGICCDLASISPKLSHSSPGVEAGAWKERHERERWQPFVLRQWAQDYSCQWKFVVRGREDVAELEKLLAEIGQPIVPHDVLLMPEGVDSGTLRSRASEVVEICLERGYRYSSRLQIELFGNTRGT